MVLFSSFPSVYPKIFWSIMKDKQKEENALKGEEENALGGQKLLDWFRMFLAVILKVK